MTKRGSLLILLLAVSVSAFAAPKVEKIGAFSGDASAKIKAALQADGYRVFLPNTLAAADVWLASKVATEKNPAQEAVYNQFTESTFLGVITFPKGGGSDFRGQQIRPGSYTMRYMVLPSDANHLGVAPNPDMVLLIPLVDDPDPSVRYDFGKMVEMSLVASHTSHPAAFEMMPAESPETSATQTDDGWIVFNGAVTDAEGKKIAVAFVLKGTGT